MVEKLYKIGELDQSCLPIRSEQGLDEDSDDDDDDETEKISVEMIDKQVFTSYSNVTIDFFVLSNRVPISLLNMPVRQLAGIYTESLFRMMMILASLHRVK
jgi:hypothetical protein